jgi:CheY-like chemotaxis protein
MSPRLIVVVNDDPVFLSLMAELLTGEGYRVIAFPGGVGAHALIKRERPDLLVLDLRMERVDTGLTVLQSVRLDAVTRNLPVIVCSADSAFLERSQERLLAQGCQVLYKPFDIDELLKLVREMLGPAR